MRTTTIFPGVKNSQKIRIMIDGFGFYTTVAGIANICTTTHRNVIHSAMRTLAVDIFRGAKITGFGSRITTYNPPGEPKSHDVQIDLVNE